MTKQLKNVAASVQTKLLQIAKARGDDFQLTLLRYVNERFLYRLGVSKHADQFILKGASLFTVWTGAPHRSTRDLDLLGFGDLTDAQMTKVFSEVLSITVPDDGLTFDVSALKVDAIREDQEYGGVRLTTIASLGTSKINVQIDVGFGDAVTPQAIETEFPALLAEYPAPTLRIYPRETVVAEKLDAIVQLGLTNTRMKDFYDLRFMSERFEFEGALLVEAIRATFERRKTSLPPSLPVALSREFSDHRSKQIQWVAFVKKARIAGTPTLQDTVEKVTLFVREPLQQALIQPKWVSHWVAGGPWQSPG